MMAASCCLGSGDGGLIRPLKGSFAAEALQESEGAQGCGSLALVLDWRLR